MCGSIDKLEPWIFGEVHKGTVKNQRDLIEKCARKNEPIKLTMSFQAELHLCVSDPN